MTTSVWKTYLLYLSAIVGALVLLAFGISEDMITSRSTIQTANVTSNRDYFEDGFHVIYYEYEFLYENSTYIGADSKSFSSRHFSEARHFENLTVVSIVVCKSDPKMSGFDDYSCGQGWVYLVGVSSSCAIGILCLFAVYVISHPCKRNDNSEHTLGATMP